MSSQRKIAEAVVAKMKGKEGRTDERGTEPEVHGEVFRGTSEDKKSRLTVNPTFRTELPSTVATQQLNA